MDCFHYDGGMPCYLRPQWTKFTEDLGSALARPDLVTRNVGCNGAPAYCICCAAPVLLSCSKPTTAIVASMGGNDLMWLPCPLIHACTTNWGCSCPLIYTRMFLCHAQYCSPGIPVIFMPDYAVHQFMPCWNSPYKRYANDLKAMAGRVVTPTYHDLDTPGDIRNSTWTYKVEKHPDAEHQNMVYIDNLVVFENMESDHEELFKTMFTINSEQTDVAYALWELWLKETLMVTARKLDQDKDGKITKDEWTELYGDTPEALATFNSYVDDGNDHIQRVYSFDQTPSTKRVAADLDVPCSEPGAAQPSTQAATQSAASSPMPLLINVAGCDSTEMRELDLGRACYTCEDAGDEAHNDAPNHTTPSAEDASGADRTTQLEHSGPDNQNGHVDGSESAPQMELQKSS